MNTLNIFLNRSLDIILSIIILVLISPILLIISLIIKFTSKGPILFKQQRLGLDNEEFTFLKFRSMYANEEGQKKHNNLKKDGILYKEKDDPRITKIGKFIRKTSIDELPQFYNVLIGEMSIVGPRPLIPFMLDNHPEFRAKRCTVKPGITGLWQIRDRKRNTNAKYMIPHDLEYIDKKSIVLDFWIILRTFKAVINSDGAY